jgi:hypothetical protein
MKAVLKLLGWCLPVALLMAFSIPAAKSLIPFHFRSLSLVAPVFILTASAYLLRSKTTLRPACARPFEFFPLLILSLGYIGSIACFYLHICMDGHMAHPIHDKADYLLDWAWAMTLICSAYVALRLKTRGAFATCSLVTFLLIYRLVFGSIGGLFPIPI